MFHKLFLVLVSSSCLWNYLALISFAQIIPDRSLGHESSTVSPQSNSNNSRTNYINGGAVRNNNLFHSFSEFNVPNQGQVYFASPTGIENIITRVTGNNLSYISGTLGVLTLKDTASHIKSQES